MMSLEEFRSWFRGEAETLPRDIKLQVFNALQSRDHRQLFLHLNNMDLQGRLPLNWKPMLDDFYSQFF